MLITEIQKTFKENAALLGDYQAISKTDLANMYCDADEAMNAAAENSKEYLKQKDLRSAAYAALMLRYWYKIFEWAQNSASLHLDYEEFVEWLSKGLYVAFYYRVWRYEYEAEVKEGQFIKWKLDADGNQIPNKYYWKLDENAPDKIINGCCGSIRGRYYQFYNKDKRKGDVQTASYDQLIEDTGDSAVGYMNCLTIEEFENDGIAYIVRSLIKNGELIEALIVDGIANFDTFKESDSMENKGASTLNERKVVKHLNSIDDAFMKYFKAAYSLDNEIVKDIYSELKSTNNTKLYRCIKKLLLELQKSPKYLKQLVN